MIDRLFRYLASARYTKALELAKTMSSQNYPPREMSFVLLTASISDLFFGKRTGEEDALWRSEALVKMQEQNPGSNEFLTLLMGLEGSKLFQAAPEEGKTMLEQARGMARSKAELGGILFFQAVFELNGSQNYEAALSLMINARQMLEGNKEFSLYSLIRFWNETMMAHCSNQLGNYKESDTLSRQVILQCKNLGFEALLENCWFNMAFAAQGMEQADKAEDYLKQDINFWESKKNPHKKGLGLTMAAVILSQMNLPEKSEFYLKEWEALNNGNEIQRAMIEGLKD